MWTREFHETIRCVIPKKAFIYILHVNCHKQDRLTNITPFPGHEIFCHLLDIGTMFLSFVALWFRKQTQRFSLKFPEKVLDTKKAQ